ncbi:MAG: hypothetical protein AB1458_15095 [Bacteroidota bacterium]
MKLLNVFIFCALVFSCASPPPPLQVTKEVIQGTWQFIDSDSMYTEVEISDSLYFYVHAPMRIEPVEPILYSFSSDSLYFLYDDGEVWKSFYLAMPDSNTLVFGNPDEGENRCNRIYPRLKLSDWTRERDFTYDSLLLAREKRFMPEQSSR